jgi:hypothetical protein
LNDTNLEPRVVYFDPNVKDASGAWIGGTWIGRDNAKIISDYFEGKSFRRKNSAQLGRWMNGIITSGRAGGAILTFAQDVAPYDVFDELSSNCLIRQFLDHGGTVLWLGDIPFYYRTKWNSEQKSFIREDVAPGSIHYLQILGVIPVSIIVASRYDLTRKGKKLGLKTPWPSLRPIVFPSQIESDRTRFVNFIRRRYEFLQLAHVEGVGVPSLRPLARTGHVRRFLDLLGTSSVKAGPLEISAVDEKKVSPQDTKSDIEFSTKYLSGWIKTFNSSSKGSGFIRLWDFSPRVITNAMLDELFSVLEKHSPRRLASSKN